MADRGIFRGRNQCDDGGRRCNDQPVNGGQILYESYTQGDCNGPRGTCVPRGNDCGNRQIQYNGGQIYESQQTKQARVQELITLRNAWLYEAQGNLKTENMGNAKVSKDGKGLVRHIEYGPDSDVKARTILAYDQNQQPMKMMVDSKQHGFKEWTRISANPAVWQDQDKVQFHGGMNMDHKSGIFSFQAAGQRDIYTYGPGGRANDPADRAALMNPGQRDTARPADTTRPAEPKSILEPKPVMEPPKKPGEVKQPEVQPATRDTARDGGSDRPVDPNKAAYDKAIKDLYGKAEIVDKTTYKDNVLGSALDKLPMVVAFGRSSDPEMVKMLENIKATQEKCVKDGKPMAAFMFVDLDKVPVQGDFRTDIGGYAKNHIGKDFGTPFMLVCNTEQGQGRTPVIPNKPMFHEKGAGDVERLTAAITAAHATQQGREIKIPGYDRPAKPVDRPIEPPKPVEVEKPVISVENFEKALSAKDGNKMEKALADLASPTGTPETLAARRDAYNQAITERTQAYLDGIKQADTLNDPEKSARMRVAFGLAQCKWAQQQMDAAVNASAVPGFENVTKRGPDGKDIVEKRPVPSAKDMLNASSFENFTTGTEFFMTAGLKFPDMYKRQDFRQAIAESGLPSTTVVGLIKNGIEKGPNWFLLEDKYLTGDKLQDDRLKRTKFQQSMETILPETFKTVPEVWPKRARPVAPAPKPREAAPLDPLKRATTATT